MVDMRVLVRVPHHTARTRLRIAFAVWSLCSRVPVGIGTRQYDGTPPLLHLAFSFLSPEPN